MKGIVVTTFYKFVFLPDAANFRDQLLALCTEHQIRGTILLASEGINSTISGTRTGIDAIMEWLRNDPRLADLDSKESQCDDRPFARLKVKLKKEIVTLRAPEADPTAQVGHYIEAKDWNNLISEPGVTIVDTRNDYEVEGGTFSGSIDPKTASFGQFPNWVAENLDPVQDQKVAMFCTGGIRCEKATALLLARGFKEVYHLKGGILKYLEVVPKEESLYKGECFIFDERESIDHGLTPKISGGFKPKEAIEKKRKRGIAPESSD